MRRVILLVCLLGCGNDNAGLVGMVTGGAGGTATDGAGWAWPDAGPGASGEAGGGDSGGAGAPGTGGRGAGGTLDPGGTGGSAAGTGGAGGESLSPDAGAGGAPLTCPQAQNFQATLCGFAGPRLVTWVGKWKDDLECAVCTSAVGQHTDCTADKDGRTTEGPGPLLCVQGCGGCCYRAEAAPCASDADCCAPLHCQAGDAGGKSCR